MSQLCLGTWYLPASETRERGSYRTVDKRTTSKLVEKALDLGINFFDTANIYHGAVHDPQNHPEHAGNSEKVLGSCLYGHDRDSLIVATKVGGNVGQLRNKSGLSRRHISWQIRESLKRLNMNYVDLYQLHWEDRDTPHQETMETMHELVCNGLVRRTGVCNHSAENMEKMMNIAVERELTKFISMQERLNVAHCEIEMDKLQLAKRYNMHLLCYSPLAGGIMTGKYLKETPIGSRGYHNEAVETEARRLRHQAELVSEIADEMDIKPAQVALAWLFRMQSKLGIGIVPIIGATSVEKLEENVASVDVHLTDERFRRLLGYEMSA